MYLLLGCRRIEGFGCMLGKRDRRAYEYSGTGTELKEEFMHTSRGNKLL